MMDSIARPTLRVPDHGVTTLHDVIVTMRDGARLAVIGAIRNGAGDPSFHRRKQGRNLCDDAGVLVCQDVRHALTRFGIDSQMQLTPLPWLAAMLLGIPLALPEDLNSGGAHGCDR